MIRLSIKYIRFFKEQSLYVLLGIIATVAILTAISSAFEMNNVLSLESARLIYGDYHYFFNDISKEQLEEAFQAEQECQIEKLGYLYSGKVYNGMDNPAVVGLKAADEGYLDIFGMALTEGRYPEKPGEIMMEAYALAYFTDEGVGTTIELTEDGKTDTYTVVGILKDGERKTDEGQKIGYVTEDSISDGYYQLYVKFKETSNIRTLEEAFRNRIKYEGKNNLNREVLYKLDNSIYPMLRVAFRMVAAQDTELSLGTMFKEWLANTGADKNLGTFFATLFSIIILYSIFRISIQQRIREYGKMLAFGIGQGNMLLLLGSELVLLFALGFPLGTLLGLFLIWMVYWINISSGRLDLSFSFANLISGKTVLINALLILLVLFLIVLVVLIQMNRMNVMETIRGSREKKKKRRLRKSSQSRIWSKKTTAMMPIVLLKYIGEKKGRVITMIVMLSFGGMVFLLGNYLAEQTERNNHLTQITDSGTSADIRVAIENSRLVNSISRDQIEAMKEISEVDTVEPVSF